MVENELQPVLRAMRKEGINIVAIHQHMSHESPRYCFLHKALDIAHSLKRVLDAQAAVKS
jgi:aspartokinase